MIGRGKNELQLRTPRRDGWTKARRELFLDTLARTCHVGHSAAAAGYEATAARRLRRRDSAFALLWAQAMADGQQRLREELLARSLGQLALGDDASAERRELPGDRVPRFDAEEARRTLKTLADLERRDGRAAARHDRPDYASDAEVTHLLIERLDALAKRLDRR